MPAQYRQPLRVGHGRNGIGGGSAQVAAATIAGNLDQQLRRILVFPRPLVELRRGHAAGIAVQPVELLEAVPHEHKLVVLGGQLHWPGQGRFGVRQGDRMESAGHDDRPPLFLSDPRGHGPLASQAAIGLQRILAEVPSCQRTVGQHAAHEFDRRDAAMADLEKMVPQVVGIARAGANTRRPQQSAVRKPRFVLHALRAPPQVGAFLAVELLGLDLFGKRQVDEAHLCPDLQARTDRHQLGREFAQRIVSGMAVRHRVRPLADVGRIEGDRHPRLCMDQQRQQRRGVAGTFDQHARRAQLADQSLHLPGTGRTVMPHREVDDPRVEINGHGQLIAQERLLSRFTPGCYRSHFLAFPNSAQDPPLSLLR